MSLPSVLKGRGLIQLLCLPDGIENPCPNVRQGSHGDSMALAFGPLALVIVLGPGFLESTVRCREAEAPLSRKTFPSAERRTVEPEWPECQRKLSSDRRFREQLSEAQTERHPMTGEASHKEHSRMGGVVIN